MNATAPRCFVIGPIGEAGSAVRRKADWVLHGLIKPVLEDPTLGYHVKRADQDPNPGSISDAMINDIYDAELVVADLTGFNPNAFYELGIRHAFQKPAIHVIAERGTKPPFDNQDQRTIEVDFEDFHHVEEARRSLKAAVSFIQGGEYRVSNPVSRARGIAELKASGDPKDVLLAELQGNLDTMADRVRRLERSSKSDTSVNKRRGVTQDVANLYRIGEYYTYIREAVTNQLQVPFEQDVIDAALNMHRVEEFVEWYSVVVNNRSGWPGKLGSLDKDSFEYLLGRDSLLQSLNAYQISRIDAETRRRMSIQD